LFRREKPEIELERGRRHGYPSPVATMEQEDAYSIDVGAGNGRQIQKESAGGDVCAGKKMPRVQALVRSVRAANQQMRTLLVL
jgi:hypothetical protein